MAKHTVRINGELSRLTGTIDAALMASGLEAAEKAEPASRIDEVISAAMASGRRIVIVSNDSEPAIRMGGHGPREHTKPKHRR